MNEFVKSAAETLGAVLPDSDVGKLLALLIVAGFLLIMTGRFKLQWIASGARQIYRWLRCKVSYKHYYQPANIGWIDIATGRPRGTYVCLLMRELIIKPRHSAVIPAKAGIQSLLLQRRSGFPISRERRSSLANCSRISSV